MKVLVVGGGIGGLTSAIALGRAGHAVTLVERAAAFSPVGAGIVLAPNAARVLASLGVDLPRVGYQLPSMDIVDERGRRLQRLDNASYATRWGPTYALTRPALSEALQRALPAAVEVRLGQALTALRQDDSGVEATVAGEATRYDLVVGADGLHSVARTLLIGDWPLRYSGVTCWRGVVANPGFSGALEAWGGAARIGVVPLPDSLVYYYLVLTAPRREPPPAWPGAFRARFAHLEAAVPRLFDGMTGAPPLHHDLEELERPHWGEGRVLLLGDAAHGMTPNQGQGAAMAIEDALVLARAVEPGADGALTRYRAAREARVRTVQLDSRRLGQVAHWEGRVARTVRDGVLRVLPSSLGDQQYRRVVEPGLALLEA